MNPRACVETLARNNLLETTPVLKELSTSCLQQEQPTLCNLDTRFTEAFDLLVSYTSKEQAPPSAAAQPGAILQPGSQSLKIYEYEAPFDTPVQACFRQEANLSMSGNSVQTSQTCPTPRMEGSGLEEPDDRANESKVAWQRDLLAAVQLPPETQPGLGNNNNNDNMSSLNTPTFDFEGLEFPALNNDAISIEDMWNIRAYSPEHLPSAPLQLVEGKSPDNLTLDKADLFQSAFPAQEEKQPVDASRPDDVASSHPNTTLSPVNHTVKMHIKPEILSTINAHDLWADDAMVPFTMKEEEEVNTSEAFDLLSYIVNDTIQEHTMVLGEEQQEPVEVPTVLEHAQLPQQLALPSTVSSSTITRPVDHQEKRATSSSAQHSKRKRGRPALPLGSRTITPRVNRLLASGDESTDTTGNLTDHDIENLRYRRMRDLNNEASKRCRESRKRKFDELERERDTELQRNMDLKKRFKSLEQAVAKLKQYYVANLARGGCPPDPSVMWSMMNLKPEDF